MKRKTTRKPKAGYGWLKIYIVGLVCLILTFPWWIRIFYPQPYPEIVARYSEAYDMDPLLIYALMRRESRYQAQVESSAGAMGLMQVLPDTAEWLSRREGLPENYPKRLKDPEVNIRLGCLYLSWLNQQFGGNVPVVLAAYNAGHGRVAQWLEEGVWDGRPDTLEQIPFPETRAYVQDVLENYRAYCLIEEFS